MLTILKTATIAGLVGLMALPALPAMADSVYLGFGSRDNDAQFGVYLGDRDRDRDRDRARDRRVERERCSPNRALDKAERMGIRRARIDFVNNRRIGVIGRHHGGRIAVTFARAPGCPVIG